MKEIIIFSHTSFTKRDYDRFGIEILKKNFKVRIFDCTNWIYKQDKDLNLNKINECVSVNSKEDFLKSINGINTPIVIDRLPINNKTNWMRKLLKKKGALFVYLNLNLVPYPKKNNINFKKIIKIIFNPMEIINKVSNFIQNKIYNFKIKSKADIFLIGGLAYKDKLKKKNIIKAHSMDYDVYLKLKNNLNIKENNYAVFLDEDIINHSDLFLEGLNKPVTEIQYYKSLKFFFNKIENESGIKVKIAFHPKRKKEIPNLLKEFIYTFENTAELVMNSKLVLAHSSTAISFAVLFKKPIIFLTTNELIKSWQQPRIENFSKILNSQIINMDEVYKKKMKIENLFTIDNKKYSDYLDQYIKFPNSPDISIWEIFSKKII